MKLSRKYPLREEHSFDFLMRKKPLQTLAGSVWVCYRFCWWLGTVSQGTRTYSKTAFKLLCTAAKPCKNDLTMPDELLNTLQTSAGQDSVSETPGPCPLSYDQSPCWESGQRIVSLHSRLCSEEGEPSGLVEALVVWGRCFGRRVEGDGDELRAPQLWRWRSSWPRFLGLPMMRWVITWNKGMLLVTKMLN